MHLMIDLETLSTKPNAVVTQIGLAVFNQAEGVIRQGQFNIQIDCQKNCGRDISSSTLLWWFQQSDGARAAFVAGDNGAGHAGHVVHEIVGWLHDLEFDGIWGHGSTFDVTILESLFSDFGVECPWPFWIHRDTRTLFAECERLGLSVNRPKPKIAHRAEDDAIAQAEWVINAWTALDGLRSATT